MAIESVLGAVAIDRSGLEERVYAALREKILKRELLPGSVLTIRQVAIALGVSPTPVRDALRRLQADALVRDRGRLGAEVVGLSAADIGDLFGARAALETYAARAAAQKRLPDLIERMRAIAQRFPETFEGDHYTNYDRFAALDTAFHQLIISGAENGRIQQMYQTLSVHLHLARIYQREIEQRARANHREHLAIVDALAAGDAEAMAEAAAAHIENVRNHILHLIGPGHILI